jgi:hypothetical protein
LAKTNAKSSASRDQSQFGADIMPISRPDGLVESASTLDSAHSFDHSWRHALVTFDRKAHPDYKLLTRMVIVYPSFLENLELVLAMGNISMDPRDNRWPAYEMILEQSIEWDLGCRPIMLPEGDSRFAQWPELARNSREWMENAKRIAVAGCKQVLEDGPDVCSSESEAKYSDHGEASIGQSAVDNETGERGQHDWKGRMPCYGVGERVNAYPSHASLQFSDYSWQYDG